MADRCRRGKVVVETLQESGRDQDHYRIQNIQLPQEANLQGSGVDLLIPILVIRFLNLQVSRQNR